eukprot:5100645-Amphidinium_carterae.1
MSTPENLCQTRESFERRSSDPGGSQDGSATPSRTQGSKELLSYKPAQQADLPRFHPLTFCLRDLELVGQGLHSLYTIVSVHVKHIESMIDFASISTLIKCVCAQGLSSVLYIRVRIDTVSSTDRTTSSNNQFPDAHDYNTVWARIGYPPVKTKTPKHMIRRFVAAVASVVAAAVWRTAYAS